MLSAKWGLGTNYPDSVHVSVCVCFATSMMKVSSVRIRFLVSAGESAQIVGRNWGLGPDCCEKLGCNANVCDGIPFKSWEE